jgi:hypothetical protein
VRYVLPDSDFGSRLQSFQDVMAATFCVAPFCVETWPRFPYLKING